MTTTSQTAYFLWVGSPLPNLARISVLSAAEAGFETVLFTDRGHPVAHPKLRTLDYREVELPWRPAQVRIKGETKPCYAAFSDLFRFASLAQNDGWWFDCDTIILRDAASFSNLMRPNKLTVGRENNHVINGAVLGSLGKIQAQHLFERAYTAFPIIDIWGAVGPALITQATSEGMIDPHILEQKYFYPVHHQDIARIYMPQDCSDLKDQEAEWYCLSLWNEVLSRSGLKHLSPPTDSYLGTLLARRPELGEMNGDPAQMANYLANNLQRLDDLHSGRIALRTFLRKASARLISRKGVRNG